MTVPPTPRRHLSIHRKMTFISCSLTLWLLLLLPRLFCTQWFVSRRPPNYSYIPARQRSFMNESSFFSFVCVARLENDCLRRALYQDCWTFASYFVVFYIPSSATSVFSYPCNSGILLLIPSHHCFMQMRHLLSLEVMLQQKLSLSYQYTMATSCLISESPW